MRLKRDVAIKVLPVGVARDPKLVAVYDIGCENGRRPATQTAFSVAGMDVLWSYTISNQVSSSPAAAGPNSVGGVEYGNDYVYVGSNDDKLYAFFADTGNLAWSVTGARAWS